MKDQIYDPQLVHLDLLRNGYRVADLFSARGWRNVAVYGAGKYGKFFCDALKDTDVNIRCVIDMNKRAENPAPGRAPLIRPEEIGEYEQGLDIIIGCLGLYQNKLPEAESAFDRRMDKVSEGNARSIRHHRRGIIRLNLCLFCSGTAGRLSE